MTTLSNTIADLLGVNSTIIELDGTYLTSTLHGELQYRWNLERDCAEYFHPKELQWVKSDVSGRAYFQPNVHPSSVWNDITRLRHDLHALVQTGRIPQ